jgi:hypothetical protein
MDTLNKYLEQTNPIVKVNDLFSENWLFQLTIKSAKVPASNTTGYADSYIKLGNSQQLWQFASRK